MLHLWHSFLYNILIKYSFFSVTWRLIGTKLNVFYTQSTRQPICKNVLFKCEVDDNLRIRTFSKQIMNINYKLNAYSCKKRNISLYISKVNLFLKLMIIFMFLKHAHARTQMHVKHII